jgi:serine phosphatase RsbU (regulator of sigma subunit)
MGRITALTYLTNATTRMMITVFVVLAGLTLSFLVINYRSHIAAGKEREFVRLTGVTKPLANAIDPVLHERLVATFADNDALLAAGSEDYATLHTQLAEARHVHDLASDVYTLVLDRQNGTFRFIGTSGINPYFKHEWKEPHPENITFFEQGAAFGPYADENGSWLSVFEPIKHEGRTVAIVQADVQFDPFLKAARAEFVRTLLFYAGIFLVTAVLLLRWMHRILKHEDQLKERLVHSAELLREKNNDLMASIRVAEQLQEAVLPKVEDVRSDLPGFSVLYLPRDTVSGDFYWHQRIGQRIYLAAGDCTGHGVPGAMMSLMACSALHTVLQSHEGRVDRMLTALDQDIRRQWQDDTDRMAGMDLTLCCIDLAQGRLSYASASRPLLVARDGMLRKLEADRAGIGGMVTAATFLEREVPVRIGDRFYLFSDGFADQAGGDKGKRLRTAALERAIAHSQDRPLEEQMRYLHQLFLDWKGPLPQVDDVLILGFEIPAHPAFERGMSAERKVA